MNFRKLSALTGVFALLASANAALADTSVNGRSASLSNLRYTLIDLNPSDGIAPSITFTASPFSSPDCCLQITTVDKDYSTTNLTGTVSGNPFSDINSVLASANNDAIIQTTATGDVRVSTGLISGKISNLIDSVKADPYAWGNTYDLGVGATNDVSNYYYFNHPYDSSLERANFVLSPYTSIVFEGDVTIDTKRMQLDDGQIAAMKELTDTYGVEFSLRGEQSVYASLQLEGMPNDDGTYFPPANVSNFKLQYLTDIDFRKTGLEETGDTHDFHHEQSFSLTLSNNYDVVKNGFLVYGLDSVSAIHASAGDILPVPEPSTLVLQGLGLAFVGTAVARHRRKPH